MKARPKMKPVMLLRLALLFALIIAAPAQAQEGWRIEPPARNTAVTIIRVLDSTTFYGFTCFRRRWSFFFNHVAPEGGACADHEACERNVARVENVIVIGDAERPAAFELFENTYYKADDITAAEMGRLLRSPLLTIRLDPRLAAMWSLPALEFPLAGLAETIEREPRRLDCPR